jgi:hypothetical protein
LNLRNDKYQSLVEKNNKILDLKNIEFILTESEEYLILTNLIKNVLQGKEVKRILIIGEDLIPIYSNLMVNFPNAKFCITSKSNNILKSFEVHFKDQIGYSTHLLDVQKGVSLHDFIYKRSKFDLVIANKIYSKLKRRKRYLSIKFLHKHFLHPNGLLCLINYIKDSKTDGFNLLKYVKPVRLETFPIKKSKYSVQFVFYRNNRKII